MKDDFDLPRKNRFDGNKTRISLETACGRKSDEKWWCPSDLTIPNIYLAGRNI